MTIAEIARSLRPRRAAMNQSRVRVLVDHGPAIDAAAIVVRVREPALRGVDGSRPTTRARVRARASPRGPPRARDAHDQRARRGPRRRLGLRSESFFGTLGPRAHPPSWPADAPRAAEAAPGQRFTKLRSAGTRPCDFPRRALAAAGLVEVSCCPPWATSCKN
jgi:hypothetical protein